MRKQPRQRRSHAMVERIVDAGQAALIAFGYEDASTNRIAELAGISPGSLYQYFANKDAVFGAVVDRYNEQVVTRVGLCAVRNLTEAPEIAVPQTISALLDALGDQPELLRAVVEQTPRLNSGHRVFAFEQQVEQLARTALAMHRERLPAWAGAESTAWLLVRTVEHLSIRYVLDRPPIAREQFVADVTRLIGNYFVAVA